MTTDERFAKAGEQFKLLEKRITELESKFNLMEGWLNKKHLTMKEVYEWYMKRLQEDTDK